MATQYAGHKRSYREMRGNDGERRFPGTQQSNGSQLESTQSRGPNPGPASYQNGAQRDNISSTRKAVCDPMASPVLVGLPGTGKSSLAVIAATAYNFRLVEFQRIFLEVVGKTTAAYRKAYGKGDYQRCSHEILLRIFKMYATGAVIVFNFLELEPEGRTLLRQLAPKHPVIHITRDAEGLQDYFKSEDVGRINTLMLGFGPDLRSICNYEYFNLTDCSVKLHESESSEPIELRDRELHGVSLTLKRVERDWLRLLRNIIGDQGRGIAHHSAYPLSRTKVEERAHTFATRVSMSDVLRANIDLDTAQIGADCVELVVPSFEQDDSKLREEVSHAFATVRRNSILPIMLTVRTFENETNRSDHQELLFKTTEHCLSLGPELCTANMTLSDIQLKQICSSTGATRIIASSEFLERPPRGWRDSTCFENFSRAAALKPSLIKITMPAMSAECSLEVHAFQAQAKTIDRAARLIAYEEGPGGRVSKCFNEILTSVQPPRDSRIAGVIYGAIRSHMTAKEITEALFATYIYEPLHFYIYGRDADYSLSPTMSSAAYEACGMRHSHRTYSSGGLEELGMLSREHKFGGAAILQPFKTTVLSMLDSISPHAKAIGAVNTLIPVRERAADGAMPSEAEIIRQRNRQGPLMGLYGTNTDWIGIRSCVRRGLSPANSVRPTSSGVVCGAGGMARAAVYSLLSLGCRNVYICNRNTTRANELAEHYNKLIAAGDISELAPNSAAQTQVQVIKTFADKWPEKARPPTMIVCCIPADNADGTRIDFTLPPTWLNSPTGGVVVEVSYKRAFTPLTNQIRALDSQGWVLLDGFEVLPEQAYAQFELFTGRRAPRKLMREQVLKHYHAITAAEKDSG